MLKGDTSKWNVAKDIEERLGDKQEDENKSKKGQRERGWSETQAKKRQHM